MGPCFTIIPSQTKAGTKDYGKELSVRFVNQLKDLGIDVKNEEGYGFHIVSSYNGWQQYHNMKEDARRFSDFPLSIMITDEWIHYKSEEYKDELIDICCATGLCLFIKYIDIYIYI